MVRRTGQALAIAAATACVALAAAAARADDAGTLSVTPPTHPLMMDTNKPQPATIPSQSPVTTTPVSPTDVNQPIDNPTSAPTAAPTTINPLMGVLLQTPVGKPLQDAGISVYGWVEGSWTYDATNVPDRVIVGRQFDTRNQSIQLDQVDVTVARSADYAKPFDIGFTVENMYGFDAAYIHSNGLSIYGSDRIAGAYPGVGGTLHVSPHAQYDLTQANATFTSNAAGGIGLEIGKFNTLLGYEVIDAYSPPGGTQNAFYSHSFIFTQEPFTHTGALLQWKPTSTVFVQGGITRGWDQATVDVNGDIDYTGQIKYSPNSTEFYALSVITGNEEPSGRQNGWRTVVDLTAQKQLSDQLTLGFNGIYAWEAQTGNGGTPGGIGQWYGVAAYGSYKVSNQLTLNVRGEWFNDPDGAAANQYSPGVGFSPTYQRTIGAPNEYYELTVGATIHPFSENAYLSNFAIRPEARLDYADHGTWSGGAQHFQFTAAIEAYYAF